MGFSEMLWGHKDGKEIRLFEFGSASGLTARVSDLGGILQSLVFRKADGIGVDLVLGYDAAEEYLHSDTFFGACIGPIADRMANGRCTLDGRIVQLPLNAGPDCMHSGPNGFHSHIWEHELIANGVVLKNTFFENDTGFPGRLDVRITYSVPSDDTLRIEYRAVCDRETAFSMTNHSYFNLSGGKSDCLKETLQLYSDGYAETLREEDPISSGRVLPVDDTPFDLRNGCVIGSVIKNTDFREIRVAGGIDNYFLTRGKGLRRHAVLSDESSHLRLTCFSDAPGLLVYTANGLEAESGKCGAVYKRNYGVCFETEQFPNAVNFPSLRDTVLLKAGQEYHSVTEFCIAEI